MPFQLIKRFIEILYFLILEETRTINKMLHSVTYRVRCSKSYLRRWFIPHVASAASENAGSNLTLALPRRARPAHTSKSDAGPWGRCYETVNFECLTNLLLDTESVKE